MMQSAYYPYLKIITTAHVLNIWLSPVSLSQQRTEIHLPSHAVYPSYKAHALKFLLIFFFVEVLICRPTELPS